MSRSRNWCYTSFNLSIANEMIDDALYVCEGLEKCPSTKKKHWQGFVIFKNARTLNSLKKKFLDVHFEIMKGNVEQNFKYCTKDGKFIELGEKPVGQGARTDLERLVEHFKEGGNMLAAIDMCPGTAVRNMNNLQKLELLYTPPRDWVMDVRIYWGEPDTGKTRSVFDEFGFSNVFRKNKTKWWDGYTGQDVVLLDDFDPERFYPDLDYDWWLEILDRYPLSVEVKGGSTQFRSHVFIITSNHDPETWFPEKKNRKAFFRRVTTIRKF